MEIESPLTPTLSPDGGEGGNNAALCRDAATPGAGGNGARLERLPVQVVEHLHRLVGGDARTERMVERFIADQYRAQNLFYLPPNVATQIIRRPADFLRAVKNHCEPELFAEGHQFL